MTIPIIFTDGLGKVHNVSPMTGDFIGLDGRRYNIVTLLGGTAPISDVPVKTISDLPWYGVVIGEDGLPYNLLALLQGYNPTGPEEEVFFFDHEPTTEESAIIPVGAIITRTDLSEE